jgi:hypothetical protein
VLTTDEIDGNDFVRQLQHREHQPYAMAVAGELKVVEFENGRNGGHLLAPRWIEPTVLGDTSEGSVADVTDTRVRRDVRFGAMNAISLNADTDCLSRSEA